MKHRSRGVLFTDQVHESLANNIKISGLTIDSLVLLLKEHLSFINAGFFVQLEQEDQSFGVYGSCLEHCDQSFLYYPETRGKGFVQGFEADSVRFQKDAIIKLSTNLPYCCIGSKKSLNEKSIERKAKKATTVFSVGDTLDIGLVSEFLLEIGYKRSGITNEPGVYSLRGDVLDVFPYHFKNPFRVSFEFDKIENISLYNPNTQISIKPIKTLKLEDFKNSSETIDNINLIDFSFFSFVYTVSFFDGVYSISTKGAEDSLDLGFKTIDVYGKTHNEKAKEALVDTIGNNNTFYGMRLYRALKDTNYSPTAEQADLAVKELVKSSEGLDQASKLNESEARELLNTMIQGNFNNAQMRPKDVADIPTLKGVSQGMLKNRKLGFLQLRAKRQQQFRVLLR